VVQTAILALVIVHEGLMLRAVRRALKTEREVAPEKLVLNVFIESQIPTLALFVLLATDWFTPYQVLVAPAVLLYFLLVILSTLRLRPVLALLTGTLSAAGYLLVTFYAWARFSQTTAQLGAFPLVMYVTYAASILTSGVLAAIVSGRIRVHVKAA